MNVSQDSGDSEHDRIRHEGRSSRSYEWLEWMSKLERFFEKTAHHTSSQRMELLRLYGYDDHDADVIENKGRALLLPLGAESLFRKKHRDLKHPDGENKTVLQNQLRTIPDLLAAWTASAPVVQTFTFVPQGAPPAVSTGEPCTENCDR